MGFLEIGNRQIYLFWDEYGYTGIADSFAKPDRDYFWGKDISWRPT
jgi:hypothetical protein